MFRYLLAILIIFTSSVSYAESKRIEKQNFHNQLIVSILYKKIPTASNITAAILNEFVLRSDYMPEDLILNITDEHITKGMIVRVAFTQNIFILTEFTKVENSNKYNINLLTYPDPLKRIKEILTKRELPKTKDLTDYESLSYKAFNGKVEAKYIVNLVNSNE